jgi:hypothetical protein
VYFWVFAGVLMKFPILEHADNSTKQPSWNISCFARQAGGFS